MQPCSQTLLAKTAFTTNAFSEILEWPHGLQFWVGLGMAYPDGLPSQMAYPHRWPTPRWPTQDVAILEWPHGLQFWVGTSRYQGRERWGSVQFCVQIFLLEYFIKESFLLD